MHRTLFYQVDDENPPLPTVKSFRQDGVAERFQLPSVGGW